MVKTKSTFEGWLVIYAGSAINLVVGALYSWSMFKSPLKEPPYNLTDAQSALPYSIACIIFALIMMPAGRLQDKIGPKIVATVGAIFVGVGFFIASLAGKNPAGSFPFLIVGFGIFVGMGIGFGYASATPPAIKWFPSEKKGLIVGIVVSGFALASLYVIPLTKYLLTLKDISFAFYSLGILFFLMLTLFSQFLKNPPPEYFPTRLLKRRESGIKPKFQTKIDYSPLEMLKTPQFWLIWIMYFIGAGSGLMVMSFLKNYADNINTITITGFFFVALLAVGNATGMVIAGMVSDKIERTKTMFLVFFLQAITLVLFSGVKSNIQFIIATIIVGFSYGACLSVFPSIAVDFYGLKNLGLNYGLLFTAWGIGSIMSPIAGKIKDVTNSYSSAFYFVAGMLVFAGIISFFAKQPERKKISLDEIENVSSN